MIYMSKALKTPCVKCYYCNAIHIRSSVFTISNCNIEIMFFFETSKDKISQVKLFIIDTTENEKFGQLNKIVTFFTVFAFVAWIADARSHDTGPMVATCNINALVGGNVTLGAFPAAVTHAATFKVLTISTAQHWTGSFEKADSTHPFEWTLQPELQSAVSVHSSLNLRMRR